MTQFPPSDDIRAVLLTLYSAYRPLDTNTLHAMHEVSESVERHFPQRGLSINIEELVARLLRLGVLRGVQLRGELHLSLTDSGYDIADAAFLDRASLGFVDHYNLPLEPGDKPHAQGSENVA